jgi:hypothetical protein
MSHFRPLTGCLWLVVASPVLLCLGPALWMALDPDQIPKAPQRDRVVVERDLGLHAETVAQAAGGERTRPEQITEDGCPPGYAGGTVLVLDTARRVDYAKDSLNRLEKVLDGQGWDVKYPEWGDGRGFSYSDLVATKGAYTIRVHNAGNTLEINLSIGCFRPL